MSAIPGVSCACTILIRIIMGNLWMTPLSKSCVPCCRTWNGSPSTGFGEPFLHPDILRFIRLYHSYGIRLTATTNGSVMTEELAEMIHKAFYSITVSCDACTKETFESIRGGLDFEKFKENVRLLRSFGKKLPMRMSTVAMRQNLHELPGIVRLAAELGFDLIIISDITTQELMRNLGDSIKCFPAAASHYLLEAEKAAKECGIQIQYPEYILITRAGIPFEEEQEILKGMKRFPSQETAEEMYGSMRSWAFASPASRRLWIISSFRANMSVTASVISSWNAPT